MKFTAVLDANVLYPAPLRDLLMRLAVADVFAAKWSERIHEEWIRNLLLKRTDLTRDRLEKIRNLMNSHVRDCLVYDYEGLESSLSLPDEDDRHVLAVAIKSSADAIVTFNLKDFPASELDKYGVEAIDPDSFLEYQLDLDPGRVIQTVKTHRACLKNPPKSRADYLDTLENCKLVMFVDRLKSYAASI